MNERFEALPRHLQTRWLDQWGYPSSVRDERDPRNVDVRRDAYERRLRKLTVAQLVLEAQKRTHGWMIDCVRREAKQRGINNMSFPKSRNVTNTKTAMGGLSGPGALLFNMSARPGALEEVEKMGQTELVNAEQLPVDCRPEGIEALKRAGVFFGEVTDGDPIFRRAVLPDGWSKRATDHHMWSDLLDDKGRVRARIFYKAAYYDRSARMEVVPRYNIDSTYHDDNSVTGMVKDSSNVLFTTETFPQQPSPSHDDYIAWRAHKTASELAREAAAQWLDTNFPEWKDPNAYWD